MKTYTINLQYKQGMQTFTGYFFSPCVNNNNNNNNNKDLFLQSLW